MGPEEQSCAQHEQKGRVIQASAMVVERDGRTIRPSKKAH